MQFVVALIFKFARIDMLF